MSCMIFRPLSILLSISLVGCASLGPRPRGMSKDLAFTKYNPKQQPNSGGVRLAVKDLIDMKGVVTTAGSKLLAKTRPAATQDAECLKIVREQNVQIVGRTNLAEFAMGTTGMNEYFGTPRSPYNTRFKKFLPGGSSSGSAVVVARDEADIALGTDTAGSIRVPAACCGVYGLKTTFGLISLKGVTPLSAKNLDTVGPLAGDVEHLAQGMDLLRRDFRSAYETEKSKHPTGRTLRVGRLRLPGTSTVVDEAVDNALKAAGFRVVDLSKDIVEAWDQAHKDGNTVAVVDGWLTNGKYGTEKDVGLITKAAMLLGDIKYPDDYQKALSRRRQWRATLARVFEKVDFIALPTLSSLPPRLPWFPTGPLLELQMLSRQNTVAVNYAGNPAIAIPVPAKDDRLPASLQLVGPRLSEAKLVNAARLVERASNPGGRLTRK